MYNPYESHITEKIMSASPIELTVMLFTAAHDSISKARKCLREHDIMGRSEAVSKAMEIVAELDSSVDPARGGEIAKGLRELYAYVLGQLQHGHLTQREQPFIEAANVLQTLKDAFAGCLPPSAEASYAPAYATPGLARYSYAA